MTIGSQLKQTMANLKGAKGTLMVYWLQSQKEDERSVYKDALEKTDRVIKDLEDRIKILGYEEPQYKGF